MMRFEAILFDLDGLLIDSEPIGLRALDTYLARYGQRPPAGFAHELIGRRAQDNALLLIERFNLPLTVADLIAEHRTLIEDMVEREASLMPGASELLALLQAHKLPVALATSSSRSYLTMILRKFGWEQTFAATVTGEEVAQGKPAPDIFLRAAELLGVPPQRCLVLEDAPHGVAAGLAAGATVLAIPNSVTCELAFPLAVRQASSLYAALALVREVNGYA